MNEFRLYKRILSERAKVALANALEGHEFTSAKTCHTCGELGVSADVHWTEIAFRAGTEWEPGV